eukprot:NODE_185_length_15706_cov_0.275902.p2 type:complete len:507 gc:universal NODE_185_length_15706_cov_0.275902:12294-13814(+)
MGRIKKKPKLNELKDMIQNWNMDAIYELDNKKMIIRMPNTIKEAIDKHPHELEKNVKVVYGTWKIGKSTVLKQSCEYALSKEFIVLYVNNDYNQHEGYSDFEEMNRTYLDKVKSEIAKGVETDQSFIKYFSSLSTAKTLEEITNVLFGLSLYNDVAFILDRWDSVPETFRNLYGAKRERILYIVAGTGSWDPKHDIKRFNNNEHKKVEFICLSKATADNIKVLGIDSKVLPEALLRISNGIIGLVREFDGCHTEDECNNKLELLFSDKSCHLYKKLVENDLFLHLKILKIGAVNNTSLIDEFWQLTGIVDLEGKFVHEVLRRSFLDLKLRKDMIKSELNHFASSKEDVFEDYCCFVFQNSKTHVVHDHIQKKETITYVTLEWDSFAAYTGQSKVRNVMYRCWTGFPTFDFFVINGDIIYGIQVSVTSTRELHDKSKSVSDMIKRAQEEILKNTNAKVIKYVYLSPSQSHLPSKSKRDHYVPESAPEYLKIDELLYDELILKLAMKK